jgi:hypothetical protein
MILISYSFWLVVEVYGPSMELGGPFLCANAPVSPLVLEPRLDRMVDVMLNDGPERSRA